MTKARFCSVLYIMIAVSYVINAQDIDLTFQGRAESFGTPIKVFVGNKISEASGIYVLDVQIDSINTDTITEVYLVSNRHVLFPNESYPDSIVIFLSEDLGENRSEWISLTLVRDEIKRKLLLTDNGDIDVSLITVDSIFKTFSAEGRKIKTVRPIIRGIMEYKAMSIEPKIGDRILVLGYPSGFYDPIAKLPVAKAGIIASSFGRNYEGDEKFLIDAKLYPSSSGSLVIFKSPTNDVIDRMVGSYDDEPFIALGIYSGEKYVLGPQIETDDEVLFEKQKMDFGNVWYFHTIFRLIDSSR
ncbi:hypothetical protein GGR28_003443 [Lewinella aquimaris]|uniref:Uncharacterized protein n=1 Tax=Neolewinella aquimaris TaxID=1835722 RepID=A0A840EFW2_9BACT|nr:hypothetical protein [Neolewinella aquimaris]MBB4080808.1 hypothetical protein [Neolewinella aquimaris]